MIKNISLSFLLSLFLFPIFQGCTKKNNENTGEWKYRIFINGNPAGKASVKISTDGNNYIHEIEMETSTQEIKNTSRKKLIETKDFRPVSLEIINKIINNSIINEIKTFVYAKENGVDVISDSGKYFVSIQEPFMFDGYYHTALLKKMHFKKGELIRSKIFDPQVENESSVILNSTVSEVKKHTYRNKEIELYHVLQYIKNLKTVELHMDQQGTIYLSRTTMLNYTMEMILE